MKIQIPWENDGLKFFLTLETKSLMTHSKSQRYAPEITEMLKDVLSDITKRVNDAPSDLAG